VHVRDEDLADLDEYVIRQEEEGRK
jgi:hypothetical protein